MKRKRCRIVLMLLALAVLATLVLATPAFAATGSTVTVGITGQCDYARAFEVLTLVNQERANVGLPALVMDTGLLDTAMLRGAETGISFDHVRPNGDAFSTAFPPGYSAAGENIAAGQTSASAVMTSWMNSPGHQANILRPQFTAIGVGCFYQNGRYYWVQVFTDRVISPASQPSNQTIVAPVEVLASTLKITANPTSLSLNAGQVVSISVFGSTPDSFGLARLAPDYCNFTVANTNTATVDAQGQVTGRASGNTTLTISTKGGNVTCLVPITVAGAGIPPVPATYTIKYYNGATLLKTVKAKAGTSLPASYAPAKTGYTFAGWYSAKTGGAKVETVTKNQSVYARYTIKKYTVKYYSGSTLLTTASVKYKGAPMAGPPKTGYTFAGWYSAKTGGSKVTVITKSQTLYARYSIKKYTTKYYDDKALRTYDAKGRVIGLRYRAGTSGFLKTVTANYNTNLSGGPKRTGYTFVGWYTSRTGGTKVTKVTGNKTVYARYRTNTYSVKYYVGSTLFSEAKISHGLRVDTINKFMDPPKKTGYTFLGWYTAKTGGAKVDRIVKAQSVYARFKKK